MVITLQNVGLGVYPVKIQWFKYFYSTDLCNPNGRPELFSVGVELIFRAFFDQSAVLDLAVGGNRKQIAHIRQAETVVLLEVVEVARGTQLHGDNRLGLVALQEFLVRHVAQVELRRVVHNAFRDREFRFLKRM